MTRTAAADKARLPGVLPGRVPSSAPRYASILTAFTSRLHGYLPALLAAFAAITAHFVSVAVYGPGRTHLGHLYIFFRLFDSRLVRLWSGYGRNHCNGLRDGVFFQTDLFNGEG